MYQRPAEESLVLVAQGQVEGIGTRPRLSAKDEAGGILVDEDLGADVRDGTTALDQLAAWLSSRFDRESLAAVGHRVVHGGPQFARRYPRDPRDRAGTSGNCRRWRRCTSRSTSRRLTPSSIACRGCRRSPVSTRPFIGATAPWPT